MGSSSSSCGAAAAPGLQSAADVSTACLPAAPEVFPRAVDGPQPVDAVLVALSSPASREVDVATADADGSQAVADAEADGEGIVAGVESDTAAATPAAVSEPPPQPAESPIFAGLDVGNIFRAGFSMLAADRVHVIASAHRYVWPFGM